MLVKDPYSCESVSTPAGIALAIPAKLNQSMTVEVAGGTFACSFRTVAHRSARSAWPSLPADLLDSIRSRNGRSKIVRAVERSAKTTAAKRFTAAKILEISAKRGTFYKSQRRWYKSAAVKKAEKAARRKGTQRLAPRVSWRRFLGIRRRTAGFCQTSYMLQYRPPALQPQKIKRPTVPAVK